MSLGLPVAHHSSYVLLAVTSVWIQNSLHLRDGPKIVLLAVVGVGFTVRTISICLVVSPTCSPKIFAPFQAVITGPSYIHYSRLTRRRSRSSSFDRSGSLLVAPVYYIIFNFVFFINRLLRRHRLVSFFSLLLLGARGAGAVGGSGRHAYLTYLIVILTLKCFRFLCARSLLYAE